MIVNEAKWFFKDDKAFLKIAKKYLKMLNPSLKNLYSFFGDNTHEVNKIKVPIFKKNISYPVLEKDISQINKRQRRGKSTAVFYKAVFYKEKGQTFLAQISVFKNGTIKIHRVPDTLVGIISELENIFEEGALKTTLLNNESGSIFFMCSATVSKHIERYFDEFAFRINRSQSKRTIVHKTIERMFRATPWYQSQIKQRLNV